MAHLLRVKLEIRCFEAPSAGNLEITARILINCTSAVGPGHRAWLLEAGESSGRKAASDSESAGTGCGGQLAASPRRCQGGAAAAILQKHHKARAWQPEGAQAACHCSALTG